MRSELLAQGVDRLLRRVALPVRARAEPDLRVLHVRPHLAQDPGRIGPDDLAVPRLDGLRPLRAQPHDEDALPHDRRRGLLLDATGIGQDELRVLHQHQHVEVARGRDEMDVLRAGDLVLQRVLPQHLVRAGVEREDDGHGALGEDLDHARQSGLVVDVLRPVQGREGIPVPWQALQDLRPPQWPSAGT